ncbi:general secretion pathway protein [Pigmentiphaga soli]|uniref:General secretion pathway protein n=1 Tax=Pigmentiphaga soli TaxID=1007095 RepID=A0ABP8GFG3_9BURK
MNAAALSAVQSRLAALRFRARRADYYEYLADVMEGTAGRKTLRDIFLDDARRYGARHPRGALSQRWAHRYQELGGDLFETLRGTLPRDDLLLIRVAQRGGAGALEQTLRDVAALTRIIEQARGNFVATVAVGLVALAVMGITLAAVPLFTVPRIRQAFAMVPPDWVGARAGRLFALADLLRDWGPPALLAAALVLYAVAWSLPALTGRLRQALDRCFVWRLYRDFQGIRFLASLATMVRKRGNVTTALRDALDVHADGAGPWLRWHVERMIARIDDGRVGADTFDTGIVDRETLWFLADLIAARGMDAALVRTRARIESRSLREAARKAAAVRWGLLLAAVGALLGLFFWHFAAIDEMCAAMINVYSSR